MAEATLEQLQKLETEHKKQLIALIQSADFRIGIAEKYGLNSKQFNQYNTIFNSLMIKWLGRNIKMTKKSGKPTLPAWIYKEQGGNWVMLFNTRAGIVKLKQLAKELDPEGKGIGFIPLIIWAVIAIVGAFTATEVVDELNNTSEEQATLVQSTKDFCKENNLSQDECIKLMTQQTEATQGSGMGLGDLIFWGGLLFVGAQFVLPAVQKATSKSST